MDRIFLWLEKQLVGLMVFLIPTNLFIKASASVYGINVDYLMPKLYASDIVILALAILLTLRLLPRLFKPHHLIKSDLLLMVMLLLMTLLVSARESHQPLAGYWYIAKLAQMSLLSLYLIKTANLDWIARPLLLTGLFQALVGIVQWFQRSSIVGYYFLGETNLGYSSQIAKSALSGEVRPLPYGTTPHPNILAGFLVLTILTLIYSWVVSPKAAPKIAYLYRPLLLLPLLLALALTQSVSAGIGLLLGILLLLIPRLNLSSFLAIATITITAGFIMAQILPEESYARRLQLMEIAGRMIQDRPWLGVGPNNFTAAMSDYGQVYGNHRFLQPVHNIYLLAISELGLVSLGLGLILLVSLLRQFPYRLTSHRPMTILIVLGAIGLFDHYPLSLQTGMLMVVLALFVSRVTPPPPMLPSARPVASAPKPRSSSRRRRGSRSS